MPGIENSPLKTDKEKSTELIQSAIDKGINILYADFRDKALQEVTLRSVGLALKNGYRKKTKIAVIIPADLIESDGDYDRLLEKQLRWLETDRVDFCLLGGLDRYSWPRLKNFGVLKNLDGSIADGTAEKAGFQFHDNFQALREVIDGYDNWSVCSFRYSYMDIDHHPGYGGLRYAADKGLAVIATDPHLGGRLTTSPAETVAEVWKTAGKDRNLSEWALRWVWHHGEVSTAVSAMRTIAQVEENTALADNIEEENLTIEEQILISRVRDAYMKMKPVPCTTCRACMPCTQGVNVPRIFEIYNDAVIYGDMETARSEYASEGHMIDNCIACGKCVNACGKQIPILEWLEAAKKRLSA